MSYRNIDFEEAKEYGRLITRKDGIINVVRIRLYDGHRYNWCQRLRCDGVICTPTDQTFDLDSNCESKPHYYDQVWFDGVCFYKKPWWRKLLCLVSKN